MDASENHRTGKLLSLRSLIRGAWTVIHGYDEDSHVMFVSIDLQVFMIQLKSLQFRNLFKMDFITTYYPYTGFHTICNTSIF